MFSLNVPLPGGVRQRIEALRPDLAGFETVREEPTLVAKRFGRLDAGEFDRIRSEVRLTLAGTPAFEARVDGFAMFEEPASGPAPVLYLVVESPGLEHLHEQLVATFGAVHGIEGEDYVPHVTVARGGDPMAIDHLGDRAIEPVTWTVSELWFWDARHDERAGRISLPT